MTAKDRALDTARKAQNALTEAETRSALSARRRNARVLTAQECGATRAELEAATGLSSARITQVLRKARQAAQA